MDGEPATYRDLAEQYYERAIDLSAVTHIYEQKPLTSGILEMLNAEVALENLKSDLEEIGYRNGAI